MFIYLIHKNLKYPLFISIMHMNTDQKQLCLQGQGIKEDGKEELGERENRETCFQNQCKRVVGRTGMLLSGI